MIVTIHFHDLKFGNFRKLLNKTVSSVFHASVAESVSDNYFRFTATTFGLMTLLHHDAMNTQKKILVRFAEKWNTLLKNVKLSKQN